MSVAASRKRTYLILSLGLLGAIVAVIADQARPGPAPAIVRMWPASPRSHRLWTPHRRKSGSSSDRVLEKIPESGDGRHRLSVLALGVEGQADPRGGRAQSDPGRRSGRGDRSSHGRRRLRR